MIITSSISIIVIIVFRNCLFFYYMHLQVYSIYSRDFFNKTFQIIMYVSHYYHNYYC